MKNKHEIIGDVVMILVTRKDGSTHKTIIDLDDLETAQNLTGYWYVVKAPRSNGFYVCGDTPKINGQKKSFVLHRLIMNAPDGLVVDHINHNTLDNRKANLRTVTHGQNLQNRRGVTLKNTSGYRGVSWKKHAGKWAAQIQIEGKNKHLGYFDDPKQAADVAREARRKYLPYSVESDVIDIGY